MGDENVQQTARQLHDSLDLDRYELKNMCQLDIMNDAFAAKVENLLGRCINARTRFGVAVNNVATERKLTKMLKQSAKKRSTHTPKSNKEEIDSITKVLFEDLLEVNE